MFAASSTTTVVLVPLIHCAAATSLISSSVLAVVLFASVSPVNPKFARVSVLVETLPFASVTWPLLSVVTFISISLTTVAPVRAPVSTEKSSPL